MLETRKYFDDLGGWIGKVICMDELTDEQVRDVVVEAAGLILSDHGKKVSAVSLATKFYYIGVLTGLITENGSFIPRTRAEFESGMEDVRSDCEYLGLDVYLSKFF